MKQKLRKIFLLEEKKVKYDKYQNDRLNRSNSAESKRKENFLRGWRCTIS
jgi:hypothetical protein